jgi:parallel beta-helix repeat protein
MFREIWQFSRIASRERLALHLGRGVLPLGFHTTFWLPSYSYSNNVIAGNWVGLAGDGISPLGNQNSGIVIDGGSRNNEVGMRLGKTIERNFIASNALFGISLVSTSDNLILGNSIGLSTTGVLRNNGAGGIRIRNSNDNRVGGTATGQGNRISFLNQPGISVVGSSVGNLLCWIIFRVARGTHFYAIVGCFLHHRARFSE